MAVSWVVVYTALQPTSKSLSQEETVYYSVLCFYRSRFLGHCVNDKLKKSGKVVVEFIQVLIQNLFCKVQGNSPIYVCELRRFPDQDLNPNLQTI
jgi:hypothetical protein